MCPATRVQPIVIEVSVLVVVVSPVGVAGVAKVVTVISVAFWDEPELLIAVTETWYSVEADKPVIVCDATLPRSAESVQTVEVANL